MARLRNSEWAMMIVQRTLEIEPGKRKLFLSTLEKFRFLDNPSDKDITKRIVKNCLTQLEKQGADLRILGKAKSGLAKINDRENVWEKHLWNFITEYQPGDSKETEKVLWKPIIKFSKRMIKKGEKQK